MPKLPKVRLLKQVKSNNRWVHATALFDSKGRVRRDHVRINGIDESHPEGSYYIEWWDEGVRHFEAAGADAQDAADKARVKQAELMAARNGIIPSLAPVEPEPDRTPLPAALDSYLETSAITDPCAPSAPTGPFLMTSRRSVPRPISTMLSARTFSTSPRSA